MSKQSSSDSSIDIRNSNVVIGRGEEGSKYYNILRTILEEMDVDGDTYIRLMPSDVVDNRLTAEVGTTGDEDTIQITGEGENDNGYFGVFADVQYDDKGLVHASNEHHPTYPSWMPDRKEWHISQKGVNQFISFLLYCGKEVAAPLRVFDTYCVYDN